MPEQNEPPRPHGDPLEKEVESDATDASNARRVEEISDSPGSDANRIPASDERDGEGRRKRYDDGADLVSRID